MNDYRVWTRWGRVGENGQNLILGDGEYDDAVRQFEKKFKDKTGLQWQFRASATNPKKGKYALIERDYDGDSSPDEGISGTESSQISDRSIGSLTTRPAESKLSKPVQRLMSLIFNKDYINETLADMAYDVEKLPLGKLSTRTLKDGYQTLKDLATLLNDTTRSASDDSIESLSNRYYTLIPHVFGRRRPPVIRTDEAIRKEILLLEALADMGVANGIMKDADAVGSFSVDPVHQLDRQFAGLGLGEMTALDIASDEYSQLHEYLVKSRGFTHDLKYNLQDVFRIERKGEADRVTNSTDNPLGDRRLLWHGSRCTNFGGILSQGLRIAPPEGR